MKELNVVQMEEINGGSDVWLGAACGTVLVVGFLGGFAGAIFATMVAPSVCGVGIGLALS